jgi:hypothetical protein
VSTTFASSPSYLKTKQSNGIPGSTQHVNSLWYAVAKNTHYPEKMTLLGTPEHDTSSMSHPLPTLCCLGQPRDISGAAVEAQNASAKVGCNGIQITTQFSVDRSIVRILWSTTHQHQRQENN